MKRLFAFLRGVFVLVCVVLLTSITIDATTSYSPSQSAIGIFSRNLIEGGCPEGMVQFQSEGTSLCIDVYEVSTSESCPHSTPKYANESRSNIREKDCTPESKEASIPWSHVTQHEARELCAKLGKRLPTAREWYDAALGVRDDEKQQVCNSSSGEVAKTGEYAECVSGSGTYDMVGNVWEWVQDEVSGGMYGSRSLPESGYVESADSAGMAVKTSGQASVSYSEDYFWSSRDSLAGVMRGGFFGSREDGGLYSVHADIELSFSGNAVGFRCVSDL